MLVLQGSYCILHVHLPACWQSSPLPCHTDQLHSCWGVQIEVMATLRQLSLRNNQLSRLPIGRGVFPPLLQHLDLSMNKLRRLPRPLVGCFWLRTLLLALNDELEVRGICRVHV